MNETEVIPAIKKRKLDLAGITENQRTGEHAYKVEHLIPAGYNVFNLTA